MQFMENFERKKNTTLKSPIRQHFYILFSRCIWSQNHRDFWFWLLFFFFSIVERVSQVDFIIFLDCHDEISLKWILHNNFPIDCVAIIVIVIIIIVDILFELVSFRNSACILVEIWVIATIFNPKYFMFRLVVKSKILIEIQLFVLDVHDLLLNLTDVFHLSKQKRKEDKNFCPEMENLNSSL